MSTTLAWAETEVRAGEVRLHLARAGAGRPLLVLHHDLGTPDRLPFYDALAQSFDVLVPHHPGYGRSPRPDWMRSARDLAVAYRGMLAELGVATATLVGLGFGGWIAAEMATMAPLAVHRLVLVGAMGIKPPEGEIFDQALVNYIEYARAGFHDRAAFDRIYGHEPTVEQLELWDICREMCFRIAWKPYMYNPTLPHLLAAIQAPALIVWGDDDRIVPRSAGEVYARKLPRARLEVVEACGHCVDMEKPTELARLIADFLR
jgi:pimeloyl-ACP methyl ester carboxylesterase